MKNTPIKEIEAKLRELKSTDDPFLDTLKDDERKGVKALVRRWEKGIELDMQLHKQFEEMSQYENSLYQQGCHHIAGVDEVGRGPLAGPVIAAAVILPKDFQLLGLTDSKKLSASKRAFFNKYIREHAVSFGIGVVDSKTIDRINIYEATKLAMRLAIEQLSVKADHLLIDAMKLDLGYPQTSIIKGDAKSISIAASSVLAKEARDSYMKELAAQYPEYGFEKNMGYGTSEHLEAIKEVGIMKEHRHSFSPVKELVVS